MTVRDFKLLWVPEKEQYRKISVGLVSYQELDIGFQKYDCCGQFFDDPAYDKYQVMMIRFLDQEDVELYIDEPIEGEREEEKHG